MKLKYRNLEKLKDLTKKEMDFLFYIARHQNLAGEIPGVHHKDVCRHTGMCKQSFYTVLRSLKAKDIIAYAKRTDIDYDVKILDNDFSYEGAFQEGYVNLNREVFRQKRFQALKAKEQYFLLELLKRTHENGRSFKISTKKLYENFSKMLGVTKRMVRYYLHSLRQFFSIGIKHGIYYITYLHSVFRPVAKAGEEEQEFTYFVEVACRRNKMQCGTKEIADTAHLIKQYRDTSGGLSDRFQQTAAMKQTVAHCIRISSEAAQNILSAKYIHRLVRQELFD